MACCKCCCGNADCTAGQLGKCCCGGSAGSCCATTEYCINGVCTPNPPCNVSGNFSTSYGQCEERGTVLRNTCACTATMTVSGGVDDDVLINFSVYEPFQYIFWSNGTVCRDGPLNGAHSFSYSTTLAPGQTIDIRGRDNAAGGSITFSWTLTCNPLP